MEEEFHIGHKIKEHIDSHGIKLQWLGRQLHCLRNTLYNLFERRWIDSDLLMRLSLVLERDFFAEFSEEYTRKLQSKGKKE
ncbi:MAG: XRE family transcriptional regulator [Bacteroidales bacterium]|nr:XRE family transcriptional regulator [Bacteroidales bacterium]